MGGQVKNLSARTKRTAFWIVAAFIAALLLVGVGMLSYWCGTGWLQVTWGRRGICTGRGLGGLGPGGVSIEEIRQVAKLVSVEAYLVADVQYTVEADVPPWLKDLLDRIGVNDEILVLTYGTVVAGFDLEDLGKDRLWVDGSRAQLQLPRPKILYRPNIDNRRTRLIYHNDRCPDFICTDSAEITAGPVLVQAEEKMLVAAKEIGLLDQAAHSGQRHFEQFLKKLGYDEVRVSVDGYDFGDE